MTEEKICWKCHESKTIYEFYLIYKDGIQRQGKCKVCNKESGKESYQNNLIKNRAIRKRWQEENRELHNKHVREYVARKRKKELDLLDIGV